MYKILNPKARSSANKIKMGIITDLPDATEKEEKR